MNEPYFVCETCKVRVEAGYRWATAHLYHDARIIEFGRFFNVHDLLDYEPFWKIPIEAEYNWLRELLPVIHGFLIAHEPHGIRFGDDVTFPESYFGMDWLDISPSADLVPRYFVDQLGFDCWQQVCDFIDLIEHKPWWWNTEDHRIAKSTFEHLIKQRP